MCLILFSWNDHPEYKLILAANRDEFYQRPTSTLHEWEQSPDILAGKDLSGGGTWMGVNRQNRFTALTNHRDPSRIVKDPPSRGNLTIDFLSDGIRPEEFFLRKQPMLDRYNGFNILTGTFNEMGYFNNVNNQYENIGPGVYGLSNAVLNTPWPKVVKARSAFREIINGKKPESDELFAMLHDKALAADEDLPETGVPYEWEKAISAIFIETETYGTCCSTVIMVDYEGRGEIRERSYPVGDRKSGEKILKFDWSAFK